MKTYVLTLSHSFPANHAMHGKPTGFFDKFMAGQADSRKGWLVSPKLHTIRANYTLWAKRIAEVQRGEAVLSVRQWSGRPYMSKQETIALLTAQDGIGIQMLKFLPDADGCILWSRFVIDNRYADIKNVANNDGLSLEDWREWFRNYDLTKPLAIIHFTSFRY